MHKTVDGKWLLFDKKGEQFERWPIDAKGMLKTGEFSLEPPEGVEPRLPAALPSAVQPIPKAKEHPLGIETVETRSGDAPPGEPVKIPTGRTGKGKKDIPGSKKD